MDEKHLEMADALTNSIIEAGISKARITQKRPDDFEGDCGCGAVIHPGRIAAGYFNCIACQEQIERRGRLYRGHE